MGRANVMVMASVPGKSAVAHSRWRMAGIATVLLAIGLGGVGFTLALHQVRETTIRVMAQAKLRAGQLAGQASDRAQDAINSTLRSVGAAVALGGDRAERPVALPDWVAGTVYAREDRLAAPVPPPHAEELTGLIEGMLRARPAGGFGIPGRTELHFERVANEPTVLALADFLDEESRSTTVVLVIDSGKLATDLLGPILAADEALELAPVNQTGGPWDQPLPGALRHWSIRPADEFVREQRSTVLAQTLVYVGLSSLALVALLIALWMLSRLVRREMALAELKSNFVADVSHELKTPLALIRLYAETLQADRVPSEEKRREYYDIIARESTRLTNLINNILDFARIEAGRKEYTLQPIDAGEVIRETYEAYRPQLDQAGFEHHLTVAPNLYKIDADRDAVSQILVNLVTNAIKYSGEDRYLLVEVSPDVRRGRRGILISVHDRGIGIRPADRAFLAQGFYRAPDPHVRQQGGTGLGLALVKHIVEVHGGSLDVESRLVKGSTFRVFLPAAEKGESTAEPSAPRGAPVAGTDSG